MSTSRMRAIAMTANWILLLSVTFSMGSCHGRRPQFEFEPKFSVNLMTPAADWPNVKVMTPAELEVYEKHGTPDYFRPLYSKSGDIASRWEAGTFIRQRKVNELKRTWIYEDAGVEIEFKSPSKFQEKPLSDKMRTLIRRGDPSEVSALQSSDLAREAWTYWDVGEKYFFTEDGKYARPVQKMTRAIGKNFTRM
jgi:hypothetical protein